MQMKWSLSEVQHEKLWFQQLTLFKMSSWKEALTNLQLVTHRAPSGYDF